MTCPVQPINPLLPAPLGQLLPLSPVITPAGTQADQIDTQYVSTSARERDHSVTVTTLSEKKRYFLS